MQNTTSLSKLHTPYRVSTDVRSYVQAAPQVLTGRRAILKVQPLLAELCRISQQHGQADNLEHFLTSLTASRKRPHLILFAPPPGEETPTVDGFAGAVLLFEYRIAGCGTRLFSTADWTGRRSVLGPPEIRGWLAAETYRVLAGRKAGIVLTTVRAEFGAHEARAFLHAPKAETLCWSTVKREFPMYLSLDGTLEETLGRIRTRTRANLRYYRRRAENRLGCTFVPQVQMTLDEFLAFNRLVTYSVPDEVAAARYRGMATLQAPFFSGLRASDGRWLSLAGGWRLRQHYFELEWQMNRADLPEFSLSTVMRSYLLEYAIALGCTRFHIEGGTPSSIQNSFEVESAVDVVMMRRSRRCTALLAFARHMLPAHNHLGQLLRDPNLRWNAVV